MWLEGVDCAVPIHVAWEVFSEFQFRFRVVVCNTSGLSLCAQSVKGVLRRVFLVWEGFFRFCYTCLGVSWVQFLFMLCARFSLSFWSSERHGKSGIMRLVSYMYRSFYKVRYKMHR